MIALVVGGASCTWDDLARAEALLSWVGVHLADVLYVAVNDVGADLPRVDHWVSLHADRIPSWQARRPGPKTWTTWTNNDPYGLCDRTLPHPGGSSGGFAVAAALEAGADRVILCGCPMESRHTHYFATPDGETQPFDEAGRFREEWVKNGLLERWVGVARSMSGWTAAKLGEPDATWLAGAMGGAA